VPVRRPDTRRASCSTESSPYSNDYEQAANTKPFTLSGTCQIANQPSASIPLIYRF